MPRELGLSPKLLEFTVFEADFPNWDYCIGFMELALDFSKWNIKDGSYFTVLSE